MSNIPKRFENAKYEDLPEMFRKRFEKSYKDNRGLYIHGDVGTGKTHYAYAIKKELTTPGTSKYVLVVNATELLREIRTDFSRDVSEKKWLDQYLMDHTELAIIDDVGSEKISDWVSEIFYMIINKRYNDMKPTIFTSNLPIKDLAERIGDRTVSRIVEMCDIVELIGDDRRFKKINKSTKIKI